MTTKIPTKIVNHLAAEAWATLNDALGEARELAQKPQFADRSTGVGLDLCVLIEKLDETSKFVTLLLK